MTNHLRNRSRLYLDIDGVIIADNSPFETINLNPIEKYSPEVVNRLGATGLELVWLSSWGNEAAYLSQSIEALSGGIILPARGNSIITKRDALIADQERLPTLFVWVDDMINSSIRRQVAKRLHVPHLLVRPDKVKGLSEANLEIIEDFARQY